MPSYGAVHDDSNNNKEQQHTGPADHALLLHMDSGDSAGDDSQTMRNPLPLIRTISESPIVHDLGETTMTIAHAQFHLSDDAMNVEDIDRIHDGHLAAAGTATIPSEVTNMTKNLIGGGVLSLSRGIALYANDPKACASAIYWVILLGTVFGYFSLLIAKSCELSLSASYRECWERTVGHCGGMFVAVMNTLDPLLGIFANASIMSQSLQLMLRAIEIQLTERQSLLLITFVALLPLCMMKNLAALAPFSAFGMAAVICALGCMTIRYLDGSYLPDGGQYYDDIPTKMQPSFGNEIRVWSTDVLPFLCMVYTSFDMHYNSPRFYAELKDASIPRFAQVTFYSFGITSVIYFSIAIVGFLTFGEHSDSYILNNYSHLDYLATISRFAIGFCSLISYPLNFIGVRDNSLDILGITDDIGTGGKLTAFTILLLSLLTLISCFVTDLGLINSVGGGTTVTFVVFLFPALMFREAIRKHPRPPSSGGGVTNSCSWFSEVWLVMILMVVGIVLGVIGVWTSIALA